MKIKKLHVRNFRCFEDFEIEFNTGNQDQGGLTVLVAKNGEGKTAILDAINVAWGPFVGKMPQAKGMGFEREDATSHQHAITGLPWLAADFEDSVVGYTDLLSIEPSFSIQRELTQSKKKPTTTIRDAKDLTKLASELFKCEKENILWPLLAYYGDNRLWASGRLTEEKTKALLHQERAYGYAYATEPKAGYKEFEKWFVDLSNAISYLKEKKEDNSPLFSENDLQRYSTLNSLLKNALEKALQITGWTSLEYHRGDKTIYAINDKTRDIVPWTSLSAGNRIVIGLVADIVQRCCKLNPQREDNALIETPGIVLIDEIELHLHPSWQQQILPTLQTIFPNIQFIVTTHSPQVVSSVPAECVRIIKDCNVFSTVGTEGAEASRILEDIFGVKPYPEDNAQRIKLMKYLEYVYQGRWKDPDVLQMRRELDEVYCGKEPLLLEADLHIENEEWEEQHSENDNLSCVCEERTEYNSGEDK